MVGGAGGGGPASVRGGAGEGCALPCPSMDGPMHFGAASQGLSLLKSRCGVMEGPMLNLLRLDVARGWRVLCKQMTVLMRGDARHDVWSPKACVCFEGDDRTFEVPRPQVCFDHDVCTAGPGPWQLKACLVGGEIRRALIPCHFLRDVCVSVD